MIMKYYGIHDADQVCGNCKFYYQHYGYYPDSPGIFSDHGYQRVAFGHCCEPRMKLRRPSQEACVHFERKDDVA